MISLPAGMVLKLALGFLKKNWKAFVVAAVIGTALFIFCDWRAQAEEIAALEYELKAERQLSRQWRDISRLQSAKALDAAEKRDAFEKQLADLLANPPVIIKWKEAEPTIDDIVESNECEDAVRELGELLKGLRHE